MAEQVNEVDIWQDGAPVISMAPNREFDVWQDGTPITDIDESNSEVPAAPRRRVFIF